MHLGTSGETFGTAGSQSHRRFFSFFVSHVSGFWLSFSFCSTRIFFGSFHLICSAFLNLLLPVLIPSCLNDLFPGLFFVTSFFCFPSPSISHHLPLSPAFLFSPFSPSITTYCFFSPHPLWQILFRDFQRLSLEL